jgi:hypothetical protein
MSHSSADSLPRRKAFTAFSSFNTPTSLLPFASSGTQNDPAL